MILQRAALTSCLRRQDRAKSANSEHIPDATSSSFSSSTLATSVAHNDRGRLKLKKTYCKFIDLKYNFIDLKYNFINEVL